MCALGKDQGVSAPVYSPATSLRPYHPPCMTPPQNERESAESVPGNSLASSFAANGPEADVEWTDDRSSIISGPSTHGLHGRAEENRDGSSSPLLSTPSPQSGSPVASSSSSQNSRWGGLLDLVSRHTAPQPVADGVFGNLVAKEETVETPPSIPDEDDDITPEGQPPTYEEASADATPSYWETTIMACSYGDEIIVGHMPVGSIIIFAWNLLISSAFSFIGFLITYLFHTTHAARSGSIVGFGITMVQSSYDMAPVEANPPGAAPEEFAPADPNSFEDGPPVGYVLHPTGQPVVRTPSQTQGSSKWLSNCVFALGILLVLKGVWDYSMALRMEAAIKKRRREQEEQSEQAQSDAEQAVAATTVPGLANDYDALLFPVTSSGSSARPAPGQAPAPAQPAAEPLGP